MASGYVWYSSGTDTTGIALANALDFESGKKTPKPDGYDVIIGWGCKPGNTYKRGDFQKQIALGKLRTLNPVEAVCVNRQKLEALRVMAGSGIPVPGFIVLEGKDATTRTNEILAAITAGKIAFPVVGHNKEHKGDPIICATAEDLARFIQKDGSTIDYVRSFCPGTEFRIHVLRNTVLLAQIKQLPPDPEQAYTESLFTDLGERYKKEEKFRQAVPAPSFLALTPAFLKEIIREAAPELLTGTGQLQRSVNRGWVLEDISLEKVPETAKTAAVQAVEAMGLDLGAVSVTVDQASVRVTNITTGPALSEAHMGIYVKAIQDFCAQKKIRKIEEKPAAAQKAKPELVARISQKLQDLSPEKAAEVLALLDSK